METEEVIPSYVEKFHYLLRFPFKMSRVNVFIILNMGCEMLYVVDQRLRAQAVNVDKSIQVMRDITCYLLEPKFLEKLSIGNAKQQVITPEHCKIMLNDIACCSLMRLDEPSMNKLWDLMTMVFKWQLSFAKTPQDLLEITFHHLDGVANIYPDVRKSALIEYTKNCVVDLWSSLDETEQMNVFETTSNWFEPFNTKISVLIRLGLQTSDGKFPIEEPSEFFQCFTKSLGSNIYAKSEELKKEHEWQKSQESLQGAPYSLANQLSAHDCQRSSQVTRNILLDDVGLGLMSENPNFAGSSQQTEFVHVHPVHRISESWESFLANQSGSMNNLFNPKK